MKKNFMLGFGLAAVALLAACSDEDEFNKGSNAEGITFTSSVSTRATDTSFSPDDQIGISMAVEGNIVAANALYKTEDATNFTSDSPLTYGSASGAASVGFFGVYPYSANVSGGVYSFTLSADAGTPLTNNDIMYANTPGIQVNTRNVPLDFSHKLAKIVMKLTDAGGSPVVGANLTITNQSVAGTLNLLDGTVAATDAPSTTLPFAANGDVSGEYQVIVMPSEAVQGRCITIENGGTAYTCPLDQEMFDTGKKYTFTVTLNANGTLEEGEPITVVPSVTDWTPEQVEKGWILSGEINVLGKNAMLLASNVEVTAEGTAIGSFDGELNADDVYSLSYTRADATDAATLLIAPKNGGVGYSYALPAGKTEGKLLIVVGDDKKQGINVSSEAGGITLTSVVAYTSSSSISMPMVIWTGDGTPGNGSAEDINESGENVAPGYEAGGWRKYVALIPFEGDWTSSFVPGATLRFHFSSDFNYKNLLLGHSALQGNNFGTVDTENGTLTTLVTYAMCDEVATIGEIPVLLNWGSYPGTLNSIELVPAEEDFGNLLWANEAPCQMDYGRFITGIPYNMAEGDIYRVHCENVVEGAKLGGFKSAWGDSGETLTPLIAEQNVTAGSATVDFVLDAATIATLQGSWNSLSSVTWIGNGLSVTKVEYIKAGE